MTAAKHTFKKKHTLFSLFAVFIFVSLLTVVVLEYLDFKSGKDSFIFKKIIHLEKGLKKKNEKSQINQILLDFARGKKINFNYFLDEDKIYHFKLDLPQEMMGKTADELGQVLKPFNYRLELAEAQKMPDKTICLYYIRIKNIITHHILITGIKKAEKTVPGKKTDQTPRIAFIIDDLGYREGISRELKALNIPITGSILPETPYAYDEAVRLQQYGLQAMIHLPMQPKNSNGGSYKSFRVITPDSADWEIRNIIIGARQIVPNAKGVNNHEGSLVTSNPKIMSRILRLVKSEGLFFVDSRTTPDTIAFELAKKMNIKSGFRDIFLDSDQSYSFSRGQIQKLIAIARQKKKAVAIGHPFETTLRAIKDSVNSIHEQGIKIVFISEILE